MPFINKKIESFVSKHKKTVAIIGFALISLHFLLILFYTLPKQFVSAKLKQVTTKYVVPGFHQQWNLFAPNVDSYDMKLYSRYYTEEWSDWEYPVNLKDHENHHLIPKIARSVVVELNVAANSSDGGIYYIDSIPYFDRLEQGYFYCQAIQYARGYYELNGIENIDSLQLKIEYEMIPSVHNLEPIENQTLIFRSRSTNEAY